MSDLWGKEIYIHSKKKRTLLSVLTKIERFSNFPPYFKDDTSSMGESDDADEIGNQEITEERHRKGIEHLLISVTLSVNVL